MRDLYPDNYNVLSTSDISSPELEEQLVMTKGNESNYAEVMTKADRGNIVWAILGIVALMFAFGMVG